MSGKREVDRGDSLLLTNEDRANGFSIVIDDRYNTTLLKQGSQLPGFQQQHSSDRIYMEN